MAFKLAIKNITANKSRTFLSLLGITIGIASVISILSLGLGFKDYIIQQVETFGTDIIEVEIKVPNTGKTSTQNISGIIGGTQITTLKLEDFEALADLKNLGNWYGGIISQQVASRKNENQQVMLWGATAGVKEVDKQYKLEKGYAYNEEDGGNLKQVAVIGKEIEKDFFPNENPIGKNIKIKNLSFRVIGVLEPRGSTGYFSFDEFIYLPAQTLQKKIMGVDYLQFGMFKIKDSADTNVTVLQMEDILRDRHNIDDPSEDDFAVTALTEAMEMLDSIFQAVNILLVSLASISLIVGGVGITNVMYVAVSERVSEVGLRKAVGAKPKDILYQFLLEAVFITLIGGIFGLLLSFALTKIISIVLLQYGFELNFPIELNSVLIALIFSLAAGLVFGVRPAQKAAKLSPMEAIRKE